MRAKEFLSEVFNPNKALPLKWVAADEAKAQMSDGREIGVRFIRHGGWDSKLFAIEFNVGGDFEMTGMGGAPEIFATVIEATKKFIHFNRGLTDGALYFTADEQSRAKMYDTLAKRVAKQVGWHVVPYEDMIKDPNYRTQLSYGDFMFAIEPGPAPEHRADAQKPQHSEFLPIFYTYSREDPEAPIFKIRARRSAEAEAYVMKHVPEYKGLDPMGVFAVKTPMPFERDLGTVPKPQPKPQPVQQDPNSLGAKLRAKLDTTS